MTFPFPILSSYLDPVVITYLGTSGAGLPIGPARSDRFVVAIGYGENDAGGSMSSVTFDGNAGTIAYGPTSSDSIGVAYRQITTGTTVTVAITQFGLVAARYYLVTGARTGFFSSASNSSSSTTLAVSSTTPTSRAGIIAAARSRNSSGSFSATAGGSATGVVLDSSGNLGGGGNPSIWAASGYTDASGASATINLNGSSNFDSGLGAILVFS